MLDKEKGQYTLMCCYKLMEDDLCWGFMGE